MVFRLCGPTGSRTLQVQYTFAGFSRAIPARKHRKGLRRPGEMCEGTFLGPQLSLCSSLWTHGESNPDLFHAMESFYRYTMGPLEEHRIRLQIVSKAANA